MTEVKSSNRAVAALRIALELEQMSARIAVEFPAVAAKVKEASRLADREATKAEK